MAVTRQPQTGTLHSSFGLISGEQVLNQWISEECASDCCGNINYVTLTDQRILIRYDGCNITSCLCGCCCKRPFRDRSIFLHQIADMETRSLSCWDRLSAYQACRCPQDRILLHGSFHGSCFPYLGGHRAVLLKPEDKSSAQQAIATAISSANRKH